MRDTSWQENRKCSEEDTDLFFPDPNDWGAVKKAKRFCKTCPVQQKCLEYAVLNNEEIGVWGGADEKERQRLRTRYQIRSRQDVRQSA